MRENELAVVVFYPSPCLRYEPEDRGRGRGNGDAAGGWGRGNGYCHTMGVIL